MCQVYGGRMCDIDGCSTTDELTHYTDDVDLCKWHKYLAKRMGVSPTKHAPDAVDSSASSEISTASEVSASEADATPATTQVM